MAATLGLGKSTVSRLLATLASEGFVTKDNVSKKYRLGLSILNLNSVVTSRLEVNREMRTILQRLVYEIGETAHIAVLEGLNVVYINRVECKRPIHSLSYIGRRNPVHCTSSGKVILANQDEEIIRYFIDNGLSKYTLNTITDPVQLRNTLQIIKKQGYSISIEELHEGITSIAAPIRDHTGKVLYAISVIGPAHRMNINDNFILNKIKRAAEEISECLGYVKT